MTKQKQAVQVCVASGISRFYFGGEAVNVSGEASRGLVTK